VAHCIAVLMKSFPFLSLLEIFLSLIYLPFNGTGMADVLLGNYSRT